MVFFMAICIKEIYLLIIRKYNNDFGIMGRLDKNNRRFSRNFIWFTQRDYTKVDEEAGLVPQNYLKKSLLGLKVSR